MIENHHLQQVYDYKKSVPAFTGTPEILNLLKIRK